LKEVIMGFEGTNEKEVGSMTLKEGSALRIFTHEYHGKVYLNVRVFDKAKDKWLPTKRGFCINFDLTKELASILAKVEA
jgi:hypothetical protein